MKTIPSVLLTHKQQASTTLTNLLLIGPLPDASYRGFSQLDKNVVYDDGNGAVTYYAHTGLDVSAINASEDLGVDNAEASALYPIATYEIQGITQAQINQGALDKVPFVIYRVNYNDLTPGRHEVMISGTIGEQTDQFEQVTVFELRSLSQQLKQPIGELDSITCRAKFGSQPIGTGGGAVEERFPCGFNANSLWVTTGCTITAVGSEADLQFTASALGTAHPVDATYAPGVVQMLTGNNAGLTREVESYTAAGVIQLQFPFQFPMVIGDTFKIRPDCTKNKNGHSSCQDTYWLTNWALHFRGEPAINPGDAATATTPGAGISKSLSGGTGEQLI